MPQNVGSSPNSGGKKDALRLVLIPTKVVFNLLADTNADVVAALSLVK